MTDEVWKDFFTDHQTARVMNSSEVWRNYASAELARDNTRVKRAAEDALDRENQLMESVEAFRQRVAGDPKLKEQLVKAAQALKNNPELRDKVDPNFLAGLSMLDLED
jgi:hypothetical protein